MLDATWTIGFPTSDSCGDAGECGDACAIEGGTRDLARGSERERSSNPEANLGAQTADGG